MTDADTPIRWRAVVHYRMEAGPLDVEHLCEELVELHNLIERGPHWDTIERIEITRVGFSTAADLTVERSRDI